MGRLQQPTIPRAIREADALMKQVCDVARLLPALTATNAAAERARLIADLEAGRMPVPGWSLRRRRRVDPQVWRMLDRARRVIAGQPLAEHYLARLAELELELAMIEALGEPRKIRPLAARRFGTGRQDVALADGPAPLGRVALAMLETLAHRDEERVVPATAPSGFSLAGLMLGVARRAGLEIEVKVEPRLSAGAATGDRTVYLAARRFGRSESLRFAVHEVLGHAVAAANARAQPIRLFEIGSAGSFGAQEGLCLCLEERARVLDAYRLRVIASRVVATDRMHDGASFGETARWLHRDHGFSAPDSIGVSERAYRGGGVARDVGYLRGWLRVRAALERGETTIDQMRAGRVGLALARELPALTEAGLARAPLHRPSLERSLLTTDSGTSPETSPPSLAASFTMLEET
ncbi:MAG TPA: DUF1704 domain-containing protein [Polyangiaceae bacterium]|nr:DUF1704 domain-containing protein [Polyangiaceae bacterium]